MPMPVLCALPAQRRVRHVPVGCGIWPAWWTHSHEVLWPNGGELDILEWANSIPGKSSFHVGLENDCTLHHSVVNTCPALGPFIDLNQGDGTLSMGYPYLTTWRAHGFTDRMLGWRSLQCAHTPSTS